MSASTIPEQHSEKYGKKLIHKSDMGNALKKLDKLTQEEALMISAENLKATYTVGEMVKEVRRSSSANLTHIGYETLYITSENQLRDNVHKWLSPPDPSINHNIACGTHEKKLSTWFIEGNIHQEWKLLFNHN